MYIYCIKEVKKFMLGWEIWEWGARQRRGTENVMNLLMQYDGQRRRNQRWHKFSSVILSVEKEYS